MYQEITYLFYSKWKVLHEIFWGFLNNVNHIFLFYMCHQRKIPSNYIFKNLLYFFILHALHSKCFLGKFAVVICKDHIVCRTVMLTKYTIHFWTKIHLTVALRVWETSCFLWVLFMLILRAETNMVDACPRSPNKNMHTKYFNPATVASMMLFHQP